MDISIILPTFNEREAAPLIIKRILSQFTAHKQIEVVVVDDCSPDGTAKIIINMYGRDKRVKVIQRQNKRPGLGSSILEGILSSSGKTIIGMDADGNHPPELLPLLIKQLQTGYDIAVASRFIGKKRFNRLQDIGSYIFNLIIRYGLGYPILDNTSGYYAIKRKVLYSLPYQDIYHNSYGEYHLRLMYAASQKRYTISEIPVVYQKRIGGASKSSLIKMLTTYAIEAYRWKKFLTSKYET